MQPRDQLLARYEVATPGLRARLSLVLAVPVHIHLSFQGRIKIFTSKSTRDF